MTDDLAACPLATMTTPPHHPVYLYCSEPDLCCGTYDPLAVLCEVDGEHWPCSTKRSHCTPAKAARLARWANGRAGRAAAGQRMQRKSRERIR